MIVFGWYAFTIKNYTRDELFQLGIAPENMKFLIKQKVVHVFWIPIFPIGKQYVLKRDGKNYEMPDVLISKLKSFETPKTPWYSFLLPILAVLAFIGITLNAKYNTYLYNKRARIEFTHKTAQKDSLIQQLDTNHFLRVKGVTRNDYGYKYLDIVAIKADTVYCLKVPTKNNSDVAIRATIKEFYIPNKKADKLKIALNALKNGYAKSYDDRRKLNKIGFQIISNKPNSPFKDNRYIFEDAFVVYDVDILVPREAMRYNFRQKTYDFKVVVFDADLTLTKIENMDEAVNWANKLPEKPSFDDYAQRYYFLLKVRNKQNPKLNLKLTFQDAKGKSHVFKIVKSPYIATPKVSKIIN